MESSSPPLTIGLPVYDGAATVARAIESLLAQTRGDFVLAVSDNASTDDTAAIVRRFAADDARVRYERRPRNVGAAANFGHLLRTARTPYFMWAGSDDVWRPTFVARNLEVLESRPEVVCSVSRVEFFDATGATVTHVGPDALPHPLEAGTFALEGTPEENVVAYLADPQANSRFYGVHRTEVLRRSYSVDERYLASDWVVMARTLAHGVHHEVPEVLLRRSVHGESSDVTRLILDTNPTWLSRRWLPLGPMTRQVLFSGDVPLPGRRPMLLARLLWILARKNFLETRHHRVQLRRRR